MPAHYRRYAVAVLIYAAGFAYILLRWDAIPDPVPVHIGPTGEVVLADINDSMLRVGRDRLLDRIETLGNRLPPPAWLFVWLCGMVAVASWLLALSGWSVTCPT
mgnify:CR=1 FL=1